MHAQSASRQTDGENTCVVSSHKADRETYLYLQHLWRGEALGPRLGGMGAAEGKGALGLGPVGGEGGGARVCFFMWFG